MHTEVSMGDGWTSYIFYLRLSGAVIHTLKKNTETHHSIYKMTLTTDQPYNLKLISPAILHCSRTGKTSFMGCVCSYAL